MGWGRRRGWWLRNNMETNKKFLTLSDLKPRYNNIGEWKPLIYLGDIDALDKEIYELTKNEYDKRIFGLLRYIKATSYNCIEFIVKTHFKIPTDFQQIGSQYGNIQLHKINFKEYSNWGNIQIYDGTLELEGATTEDIKNGLDFIDISLHRIVFGLDTNLEWFIKYPNYDNNTSRMIQLNNDDMELLRKYLTENLKGKDSIIFDVAISWYINGNSSNNIFIKFLSYCIAIESLADNLLSGKMEISSKYGIDNSKYNVPDISQCIQEKYDQLYNTDPKKFVEESYFECIGGIKKRLRKAMEIVFGLDHEYIKIFFDKVDKYCMYDLRSKLAHGSFTILDSEHKKLIEKRLPDLKYIVYAFLFRLSTGTLKEQKIKRIKSQFSISINFTDPRGTGIASTLDIFPNKDWRIRPEWLF